MKTKLIETITSNEEDVRLRIYDGELQLSEAANELLRMERAQHEATKRRLRETEARLAAALANSDR